jgi:alkaline phosphatase
MHAAHHEQHHGSATAGAPRNIIILFGDGAAATQWEFGRYTSRALRDKPFAVTDVVFKTGVLIGSGDRSRSSSSGSVVELGAAR